ncbi:hypothetical protein [Pseudomonas orientalis]|uniref:hypothetical protein n=1 Tax=Pseudomonas orientalis TaxID=76758 RepID=UPI0012FFEBDC|nr:hypothetical protein [Pseudomonas orientalis]
MPMHPCFMPAGRKEDFLGGAELTFKATTAKGRVFNCSTFMTPGILLEPPTYSRLTCTK